MIDKLKKSLYLTLVSVMLLTMMALPASAAAEPRFSDVRPGKWYFELVNDYAANGLIEGYGDGTFRPAANVTRAEFVKLLLSITHLQPESDTAEYLHAISTAKSDALTDMDGHWLTTQGWTQVALDFGLILPSDYPDGAFLPDRPATRYEAAVMITRILGLVYPAKNSTEKELPFTDEKAIPPSLRGYVFQAAEAGVLKGYPDGSVQGERMITRAEAVAMASRALAYMEQGIDPDIRVYVEQNWLPMDERTQVEVPLSNPVQVIDGTMYLPAWNLLAAYDSFDNYPFEWNYSGIWWDAELQQLYIDDGYVLVAGAGDARFEYSPSGWTISDGSDSFPAPARMLYGELMVPVYAPGWSDQLPIWRNVQWDAETKTLTMPMVRRQIPLS